MSNFLNKIPVSPITSFGNPSIPNNAVFGTNFSVLSTGGYMEVYSITDLDFVIPSGSTGLIEYSANTIPIQFDKGTGSAFSFDVITLNSDNISSGRRKIGMLVYVIEEKQVYQHIIDNYETLWNAATGATGPGGPTVVISNFGTTVKNNTVAGQNFIDAWLNSDVTGANPRWVKYYGTNLAVTGGTYDVLTNTINLVNITGGTIPISGFSNGTISAFTYNDNNVLTITDTLGVTFNVTIDVMSGLTVNGIISATTISGGTFYGDGSNLIGTKDTYVTGGTYSSGTTIFTNNTGGTFNVTGYTYLTPSLQEVINVNKVADRVEFTYPVFSGQSFIYDGVRSVYLTKVISANTTSGIYIYGNFSGYGTSNSSDIVKITSGGTIDTSFSGGTGFNNYPFTSVDMIQTSTGKLYLGGFFTTYNGVTNNYIIKLNPDGTKDTSFSAGTGFNDYTTCLGLTSDEKLFVGGRYTSYQGVASSKFIKLNSDGTKDTSFNIGSGFNSVVTDVLVLTGDSLFATGYFSTYNGSSAPRIVKLTSGGTIDTSFSGGTGFVLNTVDSPIQMFKTSDNKLLVYGWFSSYNGTSANRIIRLNFDGTVDTSFNSGTGFNDNVNNGQLMLDGRYLITGVFTSYNGINSNRTIILNSDGSVYKTFSVGVYSFELPDGRIIGESYELDDYYRKLAEIIDTYPVIDKKLTFSETTGKAEYKIGGLDSTSSQELLPKRLIQQLISSGSSTSLTGATFSNNYLALKNNSGTTLSVLIDNFTGLTVNGGLTAYTLNATTSILPTQDITVNIGTPLKRFREVNTYSGITSIWSATTIIYSPTLDLGLDSLGNSRILTADSSILNSDILLGGNY
jgi:uncharacterized delta-60 repeat protein